MYLVSSESRTQPRQNGSSMKPVIFNGCFGWLHQCVDVTTGNVAVLLCSGLNHDALNSHHALRLLADELSAFGYPTMRFDYPQTGDSCDIQNFNFHSNIDLWAVWLNSIDQAVNILRRRTGATRIILCGLRIGATLATLAASRRSDICGLILLAPVLKGQSYLRQLWIEAQLHDHDIPPLENGICFQEICFNQNTVRAIAGANLRHAILPHALKIAVFAQSDGPLLQACRSAWAAQGAEIFQTGFSGLEPLLSLNIEDDKAHPNFDCLLDWVNRTIPVQGARSPQQQTQDDATLNPPGCVETPLQFGPDRRLFGMLCCPDRQAASEIVLITNAGRDPHHGPGRFSVEFARHLAQHGVASLRLDFAGLGDSLGPPGNAARLSPLFDLERSADISAAIDAVYSLGFKKFTAYGLCAGAYHAMQAAVADARISKLLLINIPLFSWTSGETIHFVRHKNMPLRYFLVELVKLRSWAIARQKLVKSGSVLRGQFLRLSTHLANAAWSPLKFIPGGAKGKLSAGQKNMAILSRRGVKTLLLFGENDLGLDSVTQEFGALTSGPQLGENVTLLVLPDFDHLVSHAPTRRAAAQSLLAFLQQTNATPAHHPKQAALVESAQAS